MYIRKGDHIVVISGKDKGKYGHVTLVLPDAGKVVVEGVNVVKRHERAKKSGQKGTIISLALPVDVSNVALVDPKTGKGTRVSFVKKEKKVARLSKKSGNEL